MSGRRTNDARTQAWNGAIEPLKADPHRARGEDGASQGKVAP